MILNPSHVISATDIHFSYLEAHFEARSHLFEKDSSFGASFRGHER